MHARKYTVSNSVIAAYASSLWEGPVKYGPLKLVAAVGLRHEATSPLLSAIMIVRQRVQFFFFWVFFL
jgi:hypothetical protein